MICPRCRNKMVEQKGIHHKKRKYVCPKCNKIRFTRLKDVKGKAL